MQTFSKIVVFVLIICSCPITFAQENPEKKDSLKVYKQIEKYSNKRKITRFFYKLIFQPISNGKIKTHTFQKVKNQNYTTFEGKVIRKINITTLDPFGYTVQDTTAKPKVFVFKLGNFLHLKTHDFAIRNLILFRKNQFLDSLLVKESERLIRNQRYITNVTISPILVAKDSVDISIIVLDSWSLIPKFSSSTSKSDFYLTDRNFLGSGHEFSNSFTKNLTSNQNGYSTSYFVPTILNTYVNTRLSYSIDIEGNYAKSINIERPFFSIYTRWAAGINIGQNLNKINTLNENQIAEIQNSKSNFQDYWAGYSLQIFKGNSEKNRATNFISSLRYFNKNYVEQPFLPKDSLTVYDSEKLYLLGFGISSRKYTQDKYIFNFNVIEDIASGFIYNITTGYQKKYHNYNFYAGAKIALGSYFNFGYLSGGLEYGTFINEGKTSQSASSLKLVYFTNLQEIGNWKFRQFINTQIVIGNNRLNTYSDRLTLNSKTENTDFSDKNLFGTKRILATFQTQGYSPWRVLGFRLNPYLSYTAGILGDNDTGFQHRKLYSQIGLGVIVSNNHLVFNSFQFSFSFFPNSPDGNSVFRTNAIQTSDFGLQNFETTKPVLVDYQ